MKAGDSDDRIPLSVQSGWPPSSPRSPASIPTLGAGSIRKRGCQMDPGADRLGLNSTVMKTGLSQTYRPLATAQQTRSPAEGSCTPLIRVMGDVDLTRTTSTFGVRIVSSRLHPISILTHVGCLQGQTSSRRRPRMPILNASSLRVRRTASAGSCLRPIGGRLNRSPATPYLQSAVECRKVPHVPPTCHSYNPLAHCITALNRQNSDDPFLLFTAISSYMYPDKVVSTCTAHIKR